MVKFNARGKEFDIPKYLLNKYPDSLPTLLSNSEDIPVFKINNAIYLDIDPKHIESIYDMYNIGECINIDKNTFLIYDLKYLGFNIKHSIIPTLLHPIIRSKKNANPIENNAIHINIDTRIKYSNVHCSDDQIVSVDLSNGNLINTKIGSIICGTVPESLIFDGGEYIDTLICMDSILFNNILSILRDGYVIYHKHIYDNMHIAHNDGELKKYEHSHNSSTNYMVNHLETINNNILNLDKKYVYGNIEHYYKRLRQYLISYGITYEYDFEQLKWRIINYDGTISYEDDNGYTCSRYYSDIYKEFSSGEDISNIHLIQDFVEHLVGCDWIPKKIKLKYTWYGDINISNMIKNDKEIVVKCIADYFYGYGRTL